MRQGSPVARIGDRGATPESPAEVRIETDSTDGVVVADAVAIERIGDA